MKLSNKIVFGLAAAVAAAIVVYIARRSDTKRMLNQIADEGYETAHDILFPDKNIQAKHVQYGPVITI